MSEPIQSVKRRASRVLPVDDEDRVLLLHSRDPARPGVATLRRSAA